MNKFFKLIFLSFLLLNILTSIIHASKKVFIVMKVNNEIITNINIEEEYKYLIALNNDLKKINKNEAMIVARDSFLREKIKENEIVKYYNLDNFQDEYLIETVTRLYDGLGFNDENEFKRYLEEFGLTIEDVKKKIEIEIKWNQLIYERFNNQIEIDIEEMKKEIKTDEMQKNYYLSEIFFNLDDKKFDEKYNDVKKSISEVGFKNTANIFSKSDTAKLGGTIGWVSENQLSDKILKEINKIKDGEITDPIQISGGYLILKIDKRENKKISLDLEDELNKKISYEKNKQLNKFSMIYFNKIKFSTKIDEN